MEYVRRFPEFLQYMEQIQDESDLQFLGDQTLQGALSIGQGHVILIAVRVPA